MQMVKKRKLLNLDRLKPKTSPPTKRVSEMKEEMHIQNDIKRKKYWKPSNPLEMMSPAFLSRYILWEKPSITEAVNSLEGKFGNLKVVV